MNMKKALCLMVLVAALVAFGVSSALAAPAQVVSDFACNIIFPDVITISTTDTHKVSTFSQNSNATIQCKAQLPDGATPPDKALVITGDDYPDLLCGIIRPEGFVTTHDWKAVLTPSGQASLTCHYKAENP
jgi:hypothetical protein